MHFAGMLLQTENIFAPPVLSQKLEGPFEWTSSTFQHAAGHMFVLYFHVGKHTLFFRQPCSCLGLRKECNDSIFKHDSGLVHCKKCFSVVAEVIMLF